MTMLPLGSTMPVSFTDPLYDQLARIIETKHGLPPGILDAIRTKGERSNANQISPAGGRTPYQFIPATRTGMIRNYGVDPWKDATSATEAAALHLLESYKRTGDWDRAVAGYHGGIEAEHGHPGPTTRKYISRVGSFDGDSHMPLNPSLYPVPYYGRDSLAPLPTEQPEQLKETAPVLADAGPSVPVPAAAPAATHKRGGILGALESVFMPEPDSRWAAALRGGIWDAKANQIAYKQGVQKTELENQMAQAKLKSLLTKGEYQVVGNNVFHIRPDGSTEMIAPPQTKGDKIQLLERWQTMQEGDPAKALIERMLLGANDDEVITAKARSAETIARTRAGATTGAASIRAKSDATKSALPPLPPGFSVVK